MSSSYGTRGKSAGQVSRLRELDCATGETETRSRLVQSAPVAIGNAPVEHGTPADSLLFGTSLSSSSGKTKRPTTLKNRRLSSSTLRPGALSLPVQSGFPASSRGRSSSTSHTLGEDDEEGEIKPGSRKPKGETYACEKCNKVSPSPAPDRGRLLFPLARGQDGSGRG